MPKKTTKSGVNLPKLPTTMYIGSDVRKVLESAMLEISNAAGRQIKTSTFTEFIFKNYLDKARDRFIIAISEDKE